MSKIEFGKDLTCEQALDRLYSMTTIPDLNSDTVAHITNMAEQLDELRRLYERDPESFRDIPLDQRIMPSSEEDMQLMERFSFKREEPAIVRRTWRNISQDSEWGTVLPSGKCGHRSWTIHHLSPNFELEDVKLICIESNRILPPDNSVTQSNSQLEFDVGLLFPEELDSLVSELTRWER